MIVDVERLRRLLDPHERTALDAYEALNAIPDLLAVYEAACAFVDCEDVPGRRYGMELDLRNAIDRTRSKP